MAQQVRYLPHKPDSLSPFLEPVCGKKKLTPPHTHSQMISKFPGNSWGEKWGPIQGCMHLGVKPGSLLFYIKCLPIYERNIISMSATFTTNDNYMKISSNLLLLFFFNWQKFFSYNISWSCFSPPQVAPRSFSSPDPHNFILFFSQKKKQTKINRTNIYKSLQKLKTRNKNKQVKE